MASGVFAEDLFLYLMVSSHTLQKSPGVSHNNLCDEEGAETTAFVAHLERLCVFCGQAFLGWMFEPGTR